MGHALPLINRTKEASINKLNLHVQALQSTTILCLKSLLHTSSREFHDLARMLRIPTFHVPTHKSLPYDVCTCSMTEVLPGCHIDTIPAGRCGNSPVRHAEAASAVCSIEGLGIKSREEVEGVVVRVVVVIGVAAEAQCVAEGLAVPVVL